MGVWYRQGPEPLPGSGLAQIAPLTLRGGNGLGLEPIRQAETRLRARVLDVGGAAHQGRALAAAFAGSTLSDSRGRKLGILAQETAGDRDTALRSAARATCRQRSPG